MPGRNGADKGKPQAVAGDALVTLGPASSMEMTTWAPRTATSRSATGCAPLARSASALA